MWNYQTITNRLNSIRYLQVTVISSLESGHPIHMLQYGEGDKSVFLSAGMHGDEPAGVEALLRFLELSGRKTGEGIKTWYGKYQRNRPEPEIWRKSRKRYTGRGQDTPACS